MILKETTHPAVQFSLVVCVFSGVNMTKFSVLFSFAARLFYSVYICCKSSRERCELRNI
jgi:hypothetical protein